MLVEVEVASFLRVKFVPSILEGPAFRKRLTPLGQLI